MPSVAESFNRLTSDALSLSGNAQGGKHLSRTPQNPSEKPTPPQNPLPHKTCLQRGAPRRQGGKDVKIQGVTVRAIRKPLLSIGRPEVSLRRNAARRSLGLLTHEPPRNTRREQSPLSHADPSAGMPPNAAITSIPVLIPTPYLSFREVPTRWQGTNPPARWRVYSGHHLLNPYGASLRYHHDFPR